MTAAICRLTRFSAQDFLRPEVSRLGEHLAKPKSNHSGHQVHFTVDAFSKLLTDLRET